MLGSFESQVCVAPSLARNLLNGSCIESRIFYSSSSAFFLASSLALLVSSNCFSSSCSLASYSAFFFSSAAFFASAAAFFLSSGFFSALGAAVTDIPFFPGAAFF